jgi:PadR family transcriptional regulator, regulatory protein PadR
MSALAAPPLRDESIIPITHNKSSRDFMWAFRSWQVGILDNELMRCIPAKLSRELHGLRRRRTAKVPPTHHHVRGVHVRARGVVARPGTAIVTPNVLVHNRRQIRSREPRAAQSGNAADDDRKRLATSRLRASFDFQMERAYRSIGMSNKASSKAEVLRGTLDLMVLQTLAALGPQHGYAIGARLEQVSSGALTLNMGTLYPALMRLEQQGLIKAEWGVTDNNRQARYYAITVAGRRRLAADKKAWDQMVSMMHTLFADPA